MSGIVVLSDTHGDRAALRRILRQMTEADYVFHLGDHASDVAFLRPELGDKLVVVPGNCDGFGGETDRVLEVDGIKILLTHGHRYGVKQELLRLSYRAEELGASYVFFGHTHTPGIFTERGITLINPGSLSLPRFGSPSYCYAATCNGKLLAKIVYTE